MNPLPPIQTGISGLEAADTCIGRCAPVLAHLLDALRSGARVAFVSIARGDICSAWPAGVGS